MSDVDRPWDSPKPKQSESDPGSPKSKWGSQPFWIKFAAVALVIGLVGWCSAETKSNMDEADRNGDEYGAKATCQTFVEKRLKSPGTADFSSETATQDTEGEPDWTVTGVVDSENSFGGVVRNSYRCEVTSIGDDNFRLRNLETTEN